jgi:hypothetical protein
VNITEREVDMKFRKKPVVIEAVHWDGTPQAMDAIRAIDPGQRFVDFTKEHVFIETLEGQMMANLGDWIIKGVAGELYPCKPSIFEATYEPVNESTARYEAYGLMGGDEFVSGHSMKRNLLGPS